MKSVRNYNLVVFLSPRLHSQSSFYDTVVLSIGAYLVGSFLTLSDPEGSVRPQFVLWNSDETDNLCSRKGTIKGNSRRKPQAPATHNSFST